MIKAFALFAIVYITTQLLLGAYFLAQVPNGFNIVFGE